MNARNARKAQPRGITEPFPHGIDECVEDADDLSGALALWRNREERRQDPKRAVQRGSVPTDIRPRSDEDVAHFEQHWKGTGRDIYRFSAW
jgi:hypothetical protein